MRILWVSRHKPLRVQTRALAKLFGEPVEVVQDARPFDSAEEIYKRFVKGGYDDIVVVAPLSVIERLCRLGIRPLWAEMEIVDNPADADITYRGRHYRFVCFRRIRGIYIDFCEPTESGVREGTD